MRYIIDWNQILFTPFVAQQLNTQTQLRISRSKLSHFFLSLSQSKLNGKYRNCFIAHNLQSKGIAISYLCAATSLFRTHSVCLNLDIVCTFFHVLRAHTFNYSNAFSVNFAPEFHGKWHTNGEEAEKKNEPNARQSIEQSMSVCECVRGRKKNHQPKISSTNMERGHTVKYLIVNLNRVKMRSLVVFGVNCIFSHIF